MRDPKIKVLRGETAAMLRKLRASARPGFTSKEINEEARAKASRWYGMLLFFEAPQEPRSCTDCDGRGWRMNPISHFATTCYSCKGRGTFTGLDVDDLRARIIVSRGSNKGKLRKSRPLYDGDHEVETNRAYYVWRLARFHGGADVCMPIMAETCLGGDPYQPELNLISEFMAVVSFGTDLAGVARWGPSLGFVQPENVPGNLPISAYPGGPAGTEIGNLEDSPEFHTGALIDAHPDD